MDRHGAGSTDRRIQFIPAEKGWLALFGEWGEQGVTIHADPVIAWCLGVEDSDDAHGIHSFGQAVIGASPWMDKADKEDSTHFFALVREEQLEPDFVDELKLRARHSREDILTLAKRSHEQRQHGHATWLRQHRTEMRDKPPTPPLRLF